MNNLLTVITLIYILGIIVGNVLGSPLWFSFLLIILPLAFAIWGIINKKNVLFAMLGFFFVIGLLNFQIRNLPPPKNDISHIPKNQYATVIGRVDDEPRVKDDKMFFTLAVSRAGKNAVGGKVSVISQAGSVEYGDTVAISGQLEDLQGLSNPGLLSFADYLEDKGIYCQLRSTRAPPEVIEHGKGSRLKKLSMVIKSKLIIVAQKTLPEPYATLFVGIVFGFQTDRIPAEAKAAYKKAGVAHLLVASGMQLGLLAGGGLFVVRRVGLPLGLGISIVTMLNLLYALGAGLGPSILRAAIMAEIMMIGLLFEREKEIYTSLSLSAFIILLFNPTTLFNVGFQLSFAATWSLIYVAPVIDKHLRKYMPQQIASLLAVALAPGLVTSPVTIYHFSQTSLIGVLTNFLLLPWAGLLVILGFVATVAGIFFLPIAELINGANLILLWFMDWLVTFLAAFPLAEVYFATPTLPIILAYYACLMGGVEILRRGAWPKLNRFRLTVVCLSVFSLFLWNTAFSLNDDKLMITILDVGQGDSIFVKTPSGKTMLVDGGEPGMGEKVIVPFLRKKGIKDLDLLVLTHPHGDHVGGLPYVLEKIKVKTVLEPGLYCDFAYYRRFLQLIKKNNIKYTLARAGQTINLDEIKANILHPVPPFPEDINPNNVSVVFRLMYKNFSMMFTGDNEIEGEAEVLSRFSGASLAGQILKVGHHGSVTATGADFLEAVKPQAAIISCGQRNKFRHPHKATLGKLTGVGCKIFRTDLSGAVTIKTDGQTYSIVTQR